MEKTKNITRPLFFYAWEEVILSVKSCSLINLGSVSLKYEHFDLLKFSLSHTLKIHFSPTWLPCPDIN